MAQNEDQYSDDQAATELLLYVDNDGDLYRRNTQPIMRNLAQKMKRGKYDKKLAPQAWRYLVDEGAKKYTKEFAAPSAEYKSFGIFSPKIRNQVATELARRFEQQIEDGEFDVEELASKRASERRAIDRSAITIPIETFYIFRQYDGDKSGPFYSLEDAESAAASIIDEVAAERDSIPREEIERYMARRLEIVPLEREIWVTNAPADYDYTGYNFQVGTEGPLRIMALDPTRTQFQLGRYGSGLYFAAPYGSDEHAYYTKTKG